MGLAEEIASPKIRATGDEPVEVLFLGSVRGCVRNGSRPTSRQMLIELLGDAEVVAAALRSRDQTFLALGLAVSAVQNPRHTNVVDMADSCTAELLTLPAAWASVRGGWREGRPRIAFSPAECG
jgi:hypothetical protein